MSRIEIKVIVISLILFPLSILGGGWLTDMLPVGLWKEISLVVAWSLPAFVCSLLAKKWEFLHAMLTATIVAILLVGFTVVNSWGTVSEQFGSEVKEDILFVLPIALLLLVYSLIGWLAYFLLSKTFNKWILRD